ncbi:MULTISPECIES: response regulator FixJ [unclassified Sinorhizobium]|uniref:response regulator FixJ n=1 Tax=unclassified Sinorhizobium TaxID=2613772 RepID=UPI003525F65D
MQATDCVVHIVDDEESIRKSLTFLLTTVGFTVRVHESGAQFLAIASGLKNCCLVTDLRMPEMDGVELLQRLREIPVVIPSIVVTGHGDVPMAVRAMKAGAVDFIEKPFADEVLIGAIRSAAEGLAGGEAREDVASIQSNMALLTDREKEVLYRVVEGQQNKVIAYNLAISPRTVEVHRANVMAKMGAHSLPELVRMTLAAGLDTRAG